MATGKTRLLHLVFLILNYVFKHRCLCFHINLCIGSVSYDQNLNSIGTGVDNYYSNSLSRSSGLSYQNCQEPFSLAESNQNELIAYSIRYESTDIEDPDNTLLGWLRIRVNDVSKLDVFAVQPWVPQDGVNYVPGEIVTTRFKPGCRESFRGSFPKANLAPCYFAPDPSPTVPVGAVFYDSSASGEIWFNYRTGFPECAMLHEKSNLEFRFYGNAYGSQGECKVQSPQGQPLDLKRMIGAPHNKIYFKDSTYGGHDPEPPRDSDKLSCAKSLKDERPPWITSYSEPSWSSQGPVFRNNPCYEKATASGLGRFVGRCTKYNVNSGYTVGNNLKHLCDGATSQRNGSVVHVPEFGGAGDCKGCVGARNNTRKYGLSANSLIGKIIWGLRSTHGMAMAFTTMSVMPFATMTARYYKETYMGSRYVNVHMWHGIHISASLTGFAGLLSGWLAAFIGRFYFGFSTHWMGYIHWGLGYLSIFLFLFALIASPFRRFQRQPRILTIFSHFLSGSGARVLWTICLLTSFYVPGSPSALHDIHKSGFKIEYYAFIVVAWLIMDVAVHVFLMLNLIDTDKRAKFPKRRTYAIAVPIPLLRPHVETDLPGTKIRSILLMVHTVFGFVCATTLAVLICYSNTSGRWFGPLWYTHKPSGKLNMLMKESFYDE